MRSAVALCLLVFAECKEGEINPAKGLKKIAFGISIGTHTEVEVWTPSKPSVGYTPITFIFKDAEHLHYVDVSHLVVRSRLTAEYLIPMEAPAKIEHGYKGSITFLEPSTDEHLYEMDITFQRDGEEGEITFKHEVAAPTKPRLVWFKYNEDDYCAAIHLPNPPKVGLNAVQLMIYKKEKDSYSLSQDFSATIHSKTVKGVKPPRNFDVTLKPTAQRYTTTVNFVVAGDWRLTYTLSADGRTAANVSFLIHL